MKWLCNMSFCSYLYTQIEEILTFSGKIFELLVLFRAEKAALVLS